MKTLSYLISVLILAPSLLQAQRFQPEAREGMYYSSQNLTQPKPILTLPNRIPANVDQLTCFADFTNAKDGWLPIFLVNRSREAASFGIIGGKIEFKAYRQLDEENWERVQPTGSWVMCGHSAGTLEIPLGMFVSFEAAWNPTGDHTATLRYQIPGTDIFTNSGPGFWDPETRDIANSDAKILGEIPIWNSINRPFRIQPESSDKPIEEEVAKDLATIDLVLNFQKSRAMRLKCADIVAASERFPESWRESAHNRAQILLDRETDPAKSFEEFTDRCLAFFRMETHEFGSPAAFPSVVWAAISSSAINNSKEKKPWLKIFESLQIRFSEADRAELDGMSKILENQLAVHENLSDEFLFEGMKSRSRDFHTQCVKRLIERGMSKEVTTIAGQLDNSRRFSIATVLSTRENLSACHGYISDFLVECAEIDPARTLDMFYQGCGRTTKIYLSPELSLKLRPYMEQTVSIGLDGPVAINNYVEREKMIRVLEIGMRNRIPMLKKIASSEAFYEQKSTDSSGEKISKVYFMAYAAKRALAELGVAP